MGLSFQIAVIAALIVYFGMGIVRELSRIADALESDPDDHPR